MGYLILVVIVIIVVIMIASRKNEQNQKEQYVVDGAKKIWDLAEQFDTNSEGKEVEFGGIKIPVNFQIYSMAQKGELLAEIGAARKSNSKINIRDTARDLFTIVLSMIAGAIREKGGTFSQFESFYNKLANLYEKELEPIAQNIDRGNMPIAQIREDSSWYMIPTGITEDIRQSAVSIASIGMSDIINFLNSYCKS